MSLTDTTTIQISLSDREQLIRIQGKRQMQTGMAMTFADVIGWLATKEIDGWKK